MFAAGRENTIKRPVADPAENEFPDVKVLQAAEVSCLGEISFRIFKARIGGSIYCLKTSESYHSDGHFLRELKTLRRIPKKHPNIVEMIGVVASSDGKVTGLILPRICGPLLEDAPFMEESQKERRKRDISDAVSFLHKIGVIWGDAKADNIKIEKRSGRLVLLDFGGGFTEGWIDKELSETVEGDLQGVCRNLARIDRIATSKR